MCALTNRSVLFLPLSGDPSRRAYQVDVLREVRRKRLGGPKIVVGSDIPWEDMGPDDLGLEVPTLRGFGDEWFALLSVVVGQLLAFVRCRTENLRPDDPAVSESISRVVNGFTLHN